jgi:hypothetical protein
MKAKVELGRVLVEEVGQVLVEEVEVETLLVNVVKEEAILMEGMITGHQVMMGQEVHPKKHPWRLL